MPIVAALSATVQALLAASDALGFELLLSLLSLLSLLVDSAVVFGESPDLVSELDDSDVVDVVCALELRLSFT